MWLLLEKKWRAALLRTPEWGVKLAQRPRDMSVSERRKPATSTLVGVYGDSRLLQTQGGKPTAFDARAFVSLYLDLEAGTQHPNTD